MSRELETGLLSAITSNSLKPIFLCKFEFDSGDVNLWTGYGEIVFDGEVYTGAGNLLSVQPAEEATDVETRNASFTLKATSEIVSLALSENYNQRPCSIFFGALNDANTLIEYPKLIFKGKMDTMPIEDDPNNPIISLNAENDLVILDRKKARRYTDEDQKLDYPSDDGFSFVTSMQDEEITWGTA